MQTFPLAGFEVPRIGLGTNRLVDDRDGVAFVHDAVASGVRHIDTAHLYTDGASERAIGEALAGSGEDVLVATKGGYRPGEGTAEVLRAQLEQSLRSLRREAIDLYYLHRIDPDTPFEESLGVLAAEVERGTIRHVGLSQVGVEEIERAREVISIAAVQNELNAGNPDDGGVVDHCAQAGIAFVAFYPLHGPGSSEDKLRFLLDRAPNVLPIPGTRSLEHLRDNLAVLGGSALRSGA